ncbi:MAG: dipeptidase, partial [Candidatus Dormiibacterota bacterium]
MIAGKSSGGSQHQASTALPRDMTWLRDFIRIPSISADPNHGRDVASAAAKLADELRRLGIQNVTVHPTGLHPIVTGDWLHAGPGKPTVLLYGHYDVQPEGSLEEWDSPPFDLVRRGDRVYGRGAADDKGQVWMHIKSIASFLRGRNATLPINVRFLIEGEEEIGSPSLATFVDGHPDAVESAFAIVSDSPMLAYDVPSIGYALRGLVYFEVEVRTAAIDVHSGQFGGAVANAGQMLVEIVGKLHRSDGTVDVPGFYDDVEEVPDAESAAIRALPFSEADWLEGLGASSGWGEPKYTPLELTWLRPTLEINGLSSGYTGQGPKTVVPSSAHAKISCRLVPGQRADRIVELVKNYIATLARGPAQVKVHAQSAASAALVSTTHPALQPVCQAVREAFGAEPYLIRDGGTVPAVSLLGERAGVTSVLLGFGCPDENKHGPNEWLSLTHYRKGLRTLTLLWGLL